MIRLVMILLMVLLMVLSVVLSGCLGQAQAAGESTPTPCCLVHSGLRQVTETSDPYPMEDDEGLSLAGILEMLFGKSGQLRAKLAKGR